MPLWDSLNAGRMFSPQSFDKLELILLCWRHPSNHRLYMKGVTPILLSIPRLRVNSGCYIIGYYWPGCFNSNWDITRTVSRTCCLSNQRLFCRPGFPLSTALRRIYELSRVRHPAFYYRHSVYSVLSAKWVERSEQHFVHLEGVAEFDWESRRTSSQE